MPIVKTKASKAVPAKGITYILDPTKCETWGCLNLDDSCGPDASDLSAQIMETQTIYGKGKTPNERKYYHTKISWPPGDRSENGGELSTEKAAEFAKAYAEKTWPGMPVVWAIQADGNCRHIHFIVGAVMDDGRKLNPRDREYREWKDRAQEMSKEYGFSTLDWRAATKAKRAAEIQPELPVEETIAEKEMKDRGLVTWKDELRSIIDYAAAIACDMDEFREILAEEGVTLTRCTEQTISYKYGEHRACRGDKLGGDYTVEAIRDVLAHNAATPVLPEGGKVSLMEQMRGASVRTQGGRVIDADEREMWRDFGRVMGVRRSEIDAACDYVSGRSFTYQERKQGWDGWKAAKQQYYDSYNAMQNDISNQLSDRYAALKKFREIEWLLDPRNHRATFLDMIFAMIMMIKYKEQIEQVRLEVEELKMKRTVLKLQHQEFKRATTKAKEGLLDDEAPKKEFEEALKSMQSLADEICLQNLERELVRSQRGRDDWER